MKPSAKPAFYQTLWENLYERGWLKIILAKYEDKTIAGGIFPICRYALYSLNRISFREYQKFCTNNLIQQYVISWATSGGLHLYEMARDPIPSIAPSKRGFGGVETEYLYFQITRDLLGEARYCLYQRFRLLLERWGV